MYRVQIILFVILAGFGDNSLFESKGEDRSDANKRVLKLKELYSTVTGVLFSIK